jgi:hypothetical protein
MKITAGERLQLRSALGPDVLRAAERLAEAFEVDGRPPASLWHDLLHTLYRQHPDLMETPLAQSFSVAVFGRISKARGIGVGHPNSGLMSQLRSRG